MPLGCQIAVGDVTIDGIKLDQTSHGCSSAWVPFDSGRKFPDCGEVTLCLARLAAGAVVRVA